MDKIINITMEAVMSKGVAEADVLRVNVESAGAKSCFGAILQLV
jgi:hypothetical protein